VGLPISITGTAATPAISIGTNLQAMARRTTFTSASGASNGAGNRTNAAVCFRGGAALSTGSPGGFYFAATVGTPIVLASSTAGFVGLRNTTGVIAGATNTSALVNIAGFGFDRGASVWSFYTCGSATSLGASTAMTGLDVSASSWHRFQVYNPTGTAGSAVYWHARNMLTGSTASGTVTAASLLVSAASLLSVHAHVNQNGAGSVAIATGVVYLETPY
jgi:hypothetical protein